MRTCSPQVLKHICVLVLFTFFAFIANAQNTITGRVTDSKDGSGIAGVTVLVKGTRTGTQTRADGSFTLRRL